MVKILFLVDDDEDDREIFQEAINSCRPDIELIFAGDGVEALKILESSATMPDVIFLDYNMPRMNGLQCLKAIRANTKTKHVPIVMYTTSADREQEKVVLLLGADYYLRKTTSFLQLCDELKRLLEVIDSRVESQKRMQKRD